MKKKAVAVGDTNVFIPVSINEATCIGCNLCVMVCQPDVFVPSIEPAGVPVVLYPSECWYVGDCVDVCPVPDCINLHVMDKNKVIWKRKESGKYFQLS